MSTLIAPHLHGINEGTLLQRISKSLDTLEPASIKIAPWPAHNYKPSVTFVIAYSSDSILLKYYVHELCIRGFHSSANTPVHEDSCVEFFISFDEGREYYNLEFNSIGTCLFGYGQDKYSREMMPEETIKKIRRLVVIEHSAVQEKNSIYWELVVVIPTCVFKWHKITQLKGRNCRVNFYKCGDHLPHPHFLAWNNIIAASPDFHLPEFFGHVRFA